MEEEEVNLHEFVPHLSVTLYVELQINIVVV